MKDVQPSYRRSFFSLALKSEHPELQTMKFLHFLLFFYKPTKIKAYPDPQHCISVHDFLGKGKAECNNMLVKTNDRYFATEIKIVC
jgi:hypothetical protein